MKWDSDKNGQFLEECSRQNISSYFDNLKYYCIFSGDVDKSVELFVNFFLNAASIMNRTFTFNKNYKTTDRMKNSSYFDKECLEQKLILRKSLRKYRKNRSDENKRAYSLCRKNYKSFLYSKRLAFNKQKITSILGNYKNSKLFWKEIKSITFFENKSNIIETNQFFEFFKSIFQKQTDLPPICLERNKKPYFRFDIDDESFLDLNSNITEKEVQDSISSMKNEKSPGSDGILNEMLKPTASDIIPF